MKGSTSVLTHPLPDSLLVDGVRVPIHTDYRTGILFDMLAKDTSLDDLSRIRLGIWLFCGEEVPNVDTHRLFQAILAFYRGDGISADEEDFLPPEKSVPCGGVFDFVWDGDQIYASFQQVYHLDLTKIQLHWWKFLALLTALPADCAFMQTTALRCMDLGSIRDEELRRKLRRAKAAVRIRRPKRSQNEKEAKTWQTAP